VTGGAGPGEPLAHRPLAQPHRSRLSPDHPSFQAILHAHQVALAAGEPSYLCPLTGLSVLTASYLAGRGACCDSGCRHCPYLDDNEEGPTGPEPAAPAP
jgi:hypothetical protein